MDNWFVYIVRCCKDDTLYTGITTDVERRIKQHNDGIGARYTKGRAPIVLLKSFGPFTKSQALKLEHHIKQLPREEKETFRVQEQTTAETDRHHH